MKKITFFILLLTTSFCMGQAWSTGVVTLDTDFTVQFDVDSSTGLVTMTMVGPSGRWLGVGPGIASGNSMGNAGDDAIVFTSAGLQDRNMQSGNGQPNLDASQDWTLVTNNVAGSTRTVVATRAINTGDPNDFVFPTSAGLLPILWAKGGSTSFGYHTGGRGGTMANLTLGVGDLSFAARFTMSPNPSDSNFTLAMPNNNGSATVEVYNMLGAKVLTQNLEGQNNSIDASSWNTGIYLVKVIVGNAVQTKRFVKR
ncbi:MAG: T9SS type A sorting domain-containing protein [Bacteroidota bacterium]